MFYSENSMERDNFMNPVEAKAFGLIDTVLDHPPKYNESGVNNNIPPGAPNQQRIISV